MSRVSSSVLVCCLCVLGYIDAVSAMDWRSGETRDSFTGERIRTASLFADDGWSIVGARCLLGRKQVFVGISNSSYVVSDRPKLIKVRMKTDSGWSIEREFTHVDEF